MAKKNFGISPMLLFYISKNNALNGTYFTSLYSVALRSLKHIRIIIIIIVIIIINIVTGLPPRGIRI